MAQTFQINGSNLTYIGKADWPTELSGAGLDGLSPKGRWVKHVWQADVMTAAEYDTLFGFEGHKVSITTTDYYDRNGDYKTYYSVDFESINGSHNGPVFENVTMEFRVRL